MDKNKDTEFGTSDSFNQVRSTVTPWAASSFPNTQLIILVGMLVTETSLQILRIL